MRLPRRGTSLRSRHRLEPRLRISAADAHSAESLGKLRLLRHVFQVILAVIVSRSSHRPGPRILVVPAGSVLAAQ
jgi:hypothetical protein